MYNHRWSNTPIYHVCRCASVPGGIPLGVSDGPDGAGSYWREFRWSGPAKPVSTIQNCLHRLHRCFQSDLFVLGTSEQIGPTYEIRMTSPTTGLTAECRPVAVFSIDAPAGGAQLTRVSRIDLLGRSLRRQGGLKRSIRKPLTASATREVQVFDDEGVTGVCCDELVGDGPGRRLDLTRKPPLQLPKPVGVLLESLTLSVGSNTADTLAQVVELRLEVTTVEHSVRSGSQDIQTDVHTDLPSIACENRGFGLFGELENPAAVGIFPSHDRECQVFGGPEIRGRFERDLCGAATSQRREPQPPSVKEFGLLRLAERAGHLRQVHRSTLADGRCVTGNFGIPNPRPVQVDKFLADSGTTEETTSCELILADRVELNRLGFRELLLTDVASERASVETSKPSRDQINRVVLRVFENLRRERLASRKVRLALRREDIGLAICDQLRNADTHIPDVLCVEFVELPQLPYIRLGVRKCDARLQGITLLPHSLAESSKNFKRFP